MQKGTPKGTTFDQKSTLDAAGSLHRGIFDDLRDSKHLLCFQSIQNGLQSQNIDLCGIRGQQGWVPKSISGFPPPILPNVFPSTGDK